MSLDQPPALDALAELRSMGEGRREDAISVAGPQPGFMVKAAGVVDKAGSLTVTSDTGVTKAHPMLIVEQTARRDAAGGGGEAGPDPDGAGPDAYLKAKPKSPLDPDALDFDDEDADPEDVLA